MEGDLIIRDGLYWLPLIGLYTGMRIEEICQLEKRDIKQVDGVWFLDVNDVGDKRLKTQNAVRIVPLHDKLLALGLLEFWELDKKQGNDKLFGFVRADKHGRYSAMESKKLTSYRCYIGIPKGYTQHSFRATFINALKQGGVPKSIVKALVGHEQSDLTFDSYGEKYEVGVLHKAVNSIEFGIGI